MSGRTPMIEGGGVVTVARKPPRLWERYPMARKLALPLTLLVTLAAYGFCGADLRIAHAVRQWNLAHPHSAVYRVACLFGQTGTLGLYPLAALALLALAKWVRPSHPIRRVCVWLLASEALNGLVGLALKCTLARWRPNQPLEGHFALFNGFMPKCNSFPSGHTADVAAVAAVLWVVYPRLRPLYVAWVVTMAAARIAVMRHFLSDTAVGAALGVACAWLAGRLLASVQRKRSGKFSANVPAPSGQAGSPCRASCTTPTRASGPPPPHAAAGCR